MTTSDAISTLEALPYAWRLGRGRIRKREPLWGLELVRANASGIVVGRGDPAFVVEGDTLHYCVTRAVAWHETQSRR